MLAHKIDLERRTAGWIFHGTINTDADFQQYLDDINHLVYQMSASGTRPAGIQIVDEKNPMPNAYWRKKIADETGTIPSTVIYAMVTRNAAARGVLTAINWIRRPAYDFSAFSTVESAVEWIDKLRGEPSHLAELLSNLRDEL